WILSETLHSGFDTLRKGSGYSVAQIKIYGLRSHLDHHKTQISDSINACVMDALDFPKGKRAHRFIALDPSDFYYPEGRSEQYTIIEISMFEGRSIETKKKLIHRLFERLQADVNIAPADVEITIFETPRHNRGFRGQTGDEINLDYKVEI
ncbi:MAG TPA: tautomerase family protein, partial [Aggregatilineales bacterium]|nr:tautomerase family protein [Aggregatilineales bacterium]